MRGVEDTVNVVLDAGTTWVLPVTLNFSVGTADAGMSWPWPTGYVCGGGRGG